MMLSLVERLLCCVSSQASVFPEDSSERSEDGYEFVEVKPGRVLRVRHIVPERPLVEEVGAAQGGLVSCKRKITVYRNGQLYIENLGEGGGAALRRSGGGDEANSATEVELTDGKSSPPPPPTEPPHCGKDRGGGEGGGESGGGGGGEGGGGEEQPPQPPQPPQPGVRSKPRRRKPKRTIIIDCERRVTACRGTHGDLALFFIHGVGGSLDIWGAQMDFFSRLGYEVIAPDLTGHGASSAPQVPAAYTFYALAEDVRIIFKRYAKKRNVLVGHSYGVSFCTFLAHEYPEQVHKMVMINGGGPTALEPSVCSVFSLPTCVLHCLSPLLSWSFLKAGFARQGSKEKQLLRENNAFNVSPLVLRAMMSGQYWPEGDEVYHAEVTAPTLLVHGMHDKFVPVEEDQRMAEILLMAFLKVLEDGSHMVMMECPETVNTLLYEFLLWEPLTPPPRPTAAIRGRPETARTQRDNPRAEREDRASNSTS